MAHPVNEIHKSNCKSNINIKINQKSQKLFDILGKIHFLAESSMRSLIPLAVCVWYQSSHLTLEYRKCIDLHAASVKVQV